VRGGVKAHAQTTDGGDERIREQSYNALNECTQRCGVVVSLH
jgi:hypothetical protein